MISSFFRAPYVSFSAVVRLNFSSFVCFGRGIYFYLVISQFAGVAWRTVLLAVLITVILEVVRFIYVH
jgi:hypothetical protein